MTLFGETGIVFFSSWSAFVLLAFALLLLEFERLWTRFQRRKGLAVGRGVYVLDSAVVVVFLVALTIGVLALVRALATFAAPLLAPLGVSAPQGVAIGIACLFGILLIWWFRFIHSTAPTASATDNTAMLPAPVQFTGFASQANEPAVARMVAAPPIDSWVAGPSLHTTNEPAPPPDDFVLLPSMRKREPVMAEPQPESFLTMQWPTDVPPPPPRPRRRWLAPMLLTLVAGSVVAGLVLSESSPTALIATAQDLLQVQRGAAPNATVVPTVVAEPAAAVATVAPAPVVERSVAADRLNLRAAPGTDAAIIARLVRGDIVALFGDEQTIDGTTWVRVRSDENEGWVSAEFLE